MDEIIPWDEWIWVILPYRGLAKDENRLYALFASANLYVLALPREVPARHNKR